MNIVGACMNVHLPVCTGSSVNIDAVLHFDIDPNLRARLGVGLDSSVRPEANGSFDGYANGIIDPLPRISLTANPKDYGLPAGSQFSDYYAIRFSPNLYTVAQAPVPEPSTWAMGLVGLGWMTRRLRKRPARPNSCH